MKYAGYLTLLEAESVSGIKADTLKKRCQEGRIVGAVKQGNTWFVPQSEIVKSPDLVQKDLLLYNFALAANIGLEVPLTLFIDGTIIGGTTISAKEFAQTTYEALKEGSEILAQGFDEETKAKMFKSFEFLLAYKQLTSEPKKDDPRDLNFIHLKNVSIFAEGKFESFNNPVARFRLRDINGFFYGSIGVEPSN